jgi:NTE family protein
MHARELSPNVDTQDQDLEVCQVLVLQGGGALGAYQAGAFEAMAEAGREPEWVAGISIGAINAALIAGNAPADRLPRLRASWDTVTSALPAPIWTLPEGPWRRWANGCTGTAAWCPTRR